MLWFHDPIYLVVIGAGMILSLAASWKVKSAFAFWSGQPTSRGLTGADVARAILQAEGVRDVQIEAVDGELTDHYDPRTRTLRLSRPVYGARSIAAAGVAAHEVGHALQHARGYAPLKFRSAWVPLANTGAGISIFVLMAAAVMGGMQGSGGATLALIGLGLFACTTVFTLITLPVEFDASRRALVTLSGMRLLGEQELAGARKVLNAAAMTYVAAFLTSMLQLLYWAWKLGLFGQRSRDES